MMHRRDFSWVFRGRMRIFLAVASVSLLAMLTQRRAVPSQNGPAATVEHIVSAKAKLHVLDLYAKQPLNFERNDGQIDAQVKFISRGDGYTLFLTPDEAVLALRGALKQSDQGKRGLSESRPAKIESEMLRIRLVSANPGARIEAEGRLESKSNYFVGRDPKNWHANVPNFARVKYRGVYSGIDLVYYGASQRQLEYDFVIAPGADPNVIGLRFEGAKAMALNRDGDLIVRLAGGGEVIHHAPVIYQERDGKR
jgi:hypothetical protein